MTPSNKNYLGIGLVGLAIISFWIFVMPSWDRISLVQAAIEEREAMIAVRSEIIQHIENLNTQYKNKSSDVARLSSIVPKTKSEAELVSTIETLSQQSGLQLLELTTGETPSQQEELRTLFIELGLTGSYPSLVTFLDLLEKNLRLIDIFEITASQTSTPGTQVTLNLRIKANVYYLNTSNL